MAKKYTKSEIEGMIKNLKEKEKKARSKWGKAVLQDAQWLLENVIDGYDEPYELSEKLVLNGASDWGQFSWGGNALIYNGDIAEHYSTPSELKNFWGLTKDGGVKRDTNTAGEHLMDIQARALRQAWWAIRDEMNGTTEFSMKLTEFKEEKSKGLKYHKTNMQGKGSMKGKKSNFSIDYICEETCDLADFPAWSGAKDRLDEIIELGIEDEAEDYIREMFYGETPTDTQINDLLWFDMDDWIEEHREEEDDDDDTEFSMKSNFEIVDGMVLEIYDKNGNLANTITDERSLRKILTEILWAKAIKRGKSVKIGRPYYDKNGQERCDIKQTFYDGGVYLLKGVPTTWGYIDTMKMGFSIIDDTKDVLKSTGKLAGNIVKNTTDKGGILMF